MSPKRRGSASSEEEDYETRAVPTQPSQRTSARRQPRVDLSRLDAASLRKYRRVYKLGELAAGVAKEDLVPAVLRHWQSQVVEEEYETLLAFAMTLRKHSVAGGVGGCGGLKGKPRTAPKPKGK